MTSTHQLAIAYEAVARGVAARPYPRPVAAVYNPVDYARRSHRRYFERWATPPKEVVLVGMNPGPWGMAQTGVPFGTVSLVRDWLGIEEPVDRPPDEHPRKPVLGFGCRREEVSGARLWGWARDRFGTPERFFARFFVANYCPLLFLDAAGRNLTPDKLPAKARGGLEAACDAALQGLVEALRPRLVVAVGAYVERRLWAALGGSGVGIGRIHHPSPASPVANRGWAARTEAELAALGVRLP